MFVVVHDSDEEPPEVMEVGLAVSTQVGAGGGGGVVTTVTVAEQVTDWRGEKPMPL